MKEGRIVQIGTPEEIVLHPNDDYVADFVEGISRLRLVKAHSIMRRSSEISLISSSPRADIDDDLQTMIDLALKHGADQITITSQGQDIGVVTREDLLKAVRGVEVN